VVAAHAVDSTAGWRGRGAEIDVGCGGPVLAGCGAENKLPEGDGAAADVSTDEIGVGGFQSGGRGDVPGEHGTGEARGEALNLSFEAGEHVFGAAVGDVAVGPRDVSASGRARGVEERWLREQHEGTISGAAGGHGRFGDGDVFHRAAEVHGCSASAIGCSPGNGSGQSVVDFEDARAVTIGGQLAAIRGSEGCRLGAAGGGFASELEKLARGNVAEDEVGVGEIGEPVNGRAGMDAAAEIGEAGGEGICE